MIRVARTLPGELDGDINPEDYGFEVIKEEPPDESDAASRVADLYAQIRERTGLIIPPIEKYLEDAAEAEQAEQRQTPSEDGGGTSGRDT